MAQNMAMCDVMCPDIRRDDGSLSGRRTARQAPLAAKMSSGAAETVGDGWLGV